MLYRLSFEIDTDCDPSDLLEFLTEGAAPLLLKWLPCYDATRETTLEELEESCCVEPVEVKA